MTRVLVSWTATTHDFISGSNEVNTMGPTCTFHKHHYHNYQQHYILFTPDKKHLAEQLTEAISREFPLHVVYDKQIDINDISNLFEVKTQVEKFLLDLPDYGIDIFFSPGSSIMQVSWYICHTTLGLKTRLLQLKRIEHSVNKFTPDLVSIDFKHSEVPRLTYMYQQSMAYSHAKKEGKIVRYLKNIYDDALKVANTIDVTALITGLSGTGKELLAKFIHNNSTRSNKPFRAINCSGFSDNLLESRLFGFEAGSFTDAKKAYKGIFEQANGGTVFLDEIGDISDYMQQVLLRVLQTKEIEVLGGHTRKINVRIIAATNKNLELACVKGKFRWDLVYRLSVTHLHLPPLEQYPKQDKKELLNFFINTKPAQIGRNYVLELSPEAEEALLNYYYPGNIREMENIISRLYVFGTQSIGLRDLPAPVLENKPLTDLSLDTFEKKHILKVLKHKNYNMAQAAAVLNIALNTLKNKMAKFNIKIPNKNNGKL